ncbi:hypothetical protein K439DRAFT_1637446 [Ramaria rubella]|nr:hypothetical protein K439DRAFT_1637446 [Ramaria rubella]
MTLTPNAPPEPPSGTFQHLGLTLRENANTGAPPTPASTQRHASSSRPPPLDPPVGSSSESNSTFPSTDETATHAPNGPSLAAIEAQIAELLAAKSRLLATGASLPTLPTLLSNDEAINAARLSAIASAAAAKDDKKPTLPALDLREFPPHISLSPALSLPAACILSAPFFPLHARILSSWLHPKLHPFFTFLPLWR